MDQCQSLMQLKYPLTVQALQLLILCELQPAFSYTGCKTCTFPVSSTSTRVTVSPSNKSTLQFLYTGFSPYLLYLTYTYTEVIAINCKITVAQKNPQTKQQKTKPQNSPLE